MPDVGKYEPCSAVCGRKAMLYRCPFDTPNLEILMAVIRAAEKREEPVIIQHAQLS